MNLSGWNDEHGAPLSPEVGVAVEAAAKREERTGKRERMGGE
jgi:hypothetical protein